VAARRLAASSLVAAAVAVLPAAAAGQDAPQIAAPRAPLPDPRGPGLPGRPPRTVAVSGEGRVAVAPDAASFSVGVEATGRTVAAVTGEATARMKAVLDALARAGVAAKDVRTTRYDVAVERPWKDGKPGPVTGYRVSSSAEVKVRELGKLGAILEQVSAAGSNQVGALRMERLDPRPQQQEALALAYANAREKAKALAIAAGSDLGEPIQISEGGATPRPMPMMMAKAAMADAAPVPVAEGELEYGARVEVVFALR
jgi:uncharacterized protein